MIVEARPLHKKKKRLAKQRSCGPREGSEEYDPQLLKEFIVYNRYKELKRKAMEKKEIEWQRELDDAMASSEVDNQQSNKILTNNISTTTPKISTTSNVESSVLPSTTTTATTTIITPNVISTNQIASSFNTLDYIDRSPSPHSTHL